MAWQEVSKEIIATIVVFILLSLCTALVAVFALPEYKWWVIIIGAVITVSSIVITPWIFTKFFENKEKASRELKERQLDFRKSMHSNS